MRAEGCARARRRFRQRLAEILASASQGVLLFGRWDGACARASDLSDGSQPARLRSRTCPPALAVASSDPRSSLTDYIAIRDPVYVPHTAGRYQQKQFRKAQMPIVERMVNASVRSLDGIALMLAG